MLVRLGPCPLAGRSYGRSWIPVSGALWLHVRGGLRGGRAFPNDQTLKNGPQPLGQEALADMQQHQEVPR